MDTQTKSMTNSLVIHAPSEMTVPCLVPAGVIGLPVVVDATAWAVSMNGELHIFINRSGSGETLHYRILQSRQVEYLPALPLVSTGAVQCGSDLLVVGAASNGNLRVLGSTTDGEVVWQFDFDDVIPVRYPVPGCAPEPTIAWQRRHGELIVVGSGPSGISQSRICDVGGPPLDLAFGHDAIWSAWTVPSGIRLVGFGKGGFVKEILASSPSEFAIGICPEGICLAWDQAGKTLLARLLSDGSLAGPPDEMDLDVAVGGRLAFVPGPEPLVWAQRVEAREGASTEWMSTLVLAGGSPTRIDGIVHAVAGWNEFVAVVGSETLHLLQRVPAV